MHRLLTISRYSALLLLLVATAMPYILTIMFWAERHAIREAMERKLQETHLVELRLAAHEYSWVKPGKEIRYQNRMFDIKTQQQLGNISIFTGLFDDEEKALLSFFESLQQKNTQHHYGQSALLLYAAMGSSAPLSIISCAAYHESPTAFIYSSFKHSPLSKGFGRTPEQPPSVAASFLFI